LTEVSCVLLIPSVYSKMAECLLQGDVVDASKTLYGFSHYANTVPIVPDLTFSEMGFLRYSKQHPDEVEERKLLSKSQEKEKRRSERAQNEISKCFKPSRTLGDGIEQAEMQHTGYTSSADQKLRQAVSLKNTYQSSCSRSTSQSIDFGKEPLLGLDRRQNFEPLVPMTPSRCQMVQPMAVPNTVKNLSDKVASQYTWSDGVRSSEASKRNWKMNPEGSTTPESIRQMLNNTGIFGYTGIDRSISRPTKNVGRNSARSHGHTMPQKVFKISNDTSSTTHLRRASHAYTQNRRSFDVGKIRIFRHHRRHEEEQIRGLNDTTNSDINSGQVIRPTRTIVQYYSPESGWRENPTDGEVVAHHLPKGEVLQGTSRQVIAHEAYVKLARTSIAAALGVDDSKHTKLSAATQKEGATAQKQLTKQLMHEISNAETADYSPPLKAGKEKLGGVTCSTKIDPAHSLTDHHMDHRGPVQGLMAVRSESTSERQSNTSQVPGSLSVPFRALVTSPNLSPTNHQVNGGLDQNRETRLEGRSHSTAPANTFGGLPVRGSWPSGASRSISASHAVFTQMAIEPLYNYQLHKSISYDLADQIYEEDNQTGLLPDRCDSPLSKHSSNLEGKQYGTFEGEYELLNSTDNLPEGDIAFPDELDTEEFMVRAEEEDGHTLYQEMTLHAASEKHSHERAQPSGTFNQQHLYFMGPALDREASPYYHSGNTVQEHVLEENDWDQQELTRFWLPYRQY
jgi:hypothetical protein